MNTMNNNDIFNKIEDSPSEKFRFEVVSFLKQQLPALVGDLDHAVSIAYDIAGLMATTHARELGSGDPIDEILTIAGELETNPDNAEELRRELVNKIKALP